MSTRDIVILVVAVVVVLLVIGLLVALARRRSHAKAEQRRLEAGRLREQAATRTTDVHRSETDVAEAEAEAQAARARADRAEQHAADVRQAAAVDQARQEDVLRRADAVDPDVDHRADDYSPTTPTVQGPADPPPTGGSHRAG